MPFRVFGLETNILKAVQEAGYTEPTPIQSAAIPHILAGHDLIGIAQTGTGKTAAFVLPILAKLAGVSRGGGPRGIRALIVAPTRELAAQIEENVRAYGKPSSSPRPCRGKSRCSLTSFSARLSPSRSVAGRTPKKLSRNSFMRCQSTSSPPCSYICCASRASIWCWSFRA